MNLLNLHYLFNAKLFPVMSALVSEQGKKAGNAFFKTIMQKKTSGGSQHDMIIAGIVFLIAFIIFIVIFKNANKRIDARRKQKAYIQHTKDAEEMADRMEENDNDEDDFWRE